MQLVQVAHPFFLVAVVDGQVLVRSNGVEEGTWEGGYPFFETTLLSQSLLLTTILKLIPDFPNLIIALNMKEHGGSLRSVRGGFPAFTEIWQDGNAEIASWPLHAQVPAYRVRSPFGSNTVWTMFAF